MARILGQEAEEAPRCGEEGRENKVPSRFPRGQAFTQALLQPRARREEGQELEEGQEGAEGKGTRCQEASCPEEGRYQKEGACCQDAHGSCQEEEGCCEEGRC